MFLTLRLSLPSTALMFGTSSTINILNGSTDTIELDVDDVVVDEDAAVVDVVVVELVVVVVVDVVVALETLSPLVIVALDDVTPSDDAVVDVVALVGVAVDND